jgi:peptidase MA superfamily protein
MGRLTLRARSALAPILAAFTLVALLAPPAFAADDTAVTFGKPEASAKYGEKIEFVQPVELGSPADRVEVRLTFADDPGPIVIEHEAVGAGKQTLRDSVDFADGGHIYPNTKITAQWRVYQGADDTNGTDGPPITITYDDDRFDWNVLEGDFVRVHWYEGDEAFGRRVLELGEKTVRETAELLGVDTGEPFDFFIYPDTDTFYTAIDPSTQEGVGGQALAELRTMYGRIGPGDEDGSEVGRVVPHELVHLVFDTATKNPYHLPPRWLNEGLAVYLSEGNGADYRLAVNDAVGGNAVIPIDGLTGQFPRTFDRFYLAYAESVSAIDYLIRSYGRDALVQLIKSYAEGRTDDEAFHDALGVDVEAFGDAWLADIGARPPERFGPQPAPAGPQPPGWGEGGGAPLPGAPVGSAEPGPAAPGAPAGEVDATQAAERPIRLALLLVVILVGGALVLGIALRRRPART